MANIDNIKVLCFSSDNYNLEDLNTMTEAERFELAQVACNFGYDEADILTLSDFQRLFNDGTISNTYIFFYLEA